ncbi:DUF2194 domain-containing protein [Cohnella caldifontis]|uniref:DUF2194 domain-containing protein n=1 Tax=Cohnella caldifontis TaxID=3027471 RepID=UPI0023EB335B|nr:DUF2194 domain-containing protein [Cohnella sp. YIM B05605]
MRRKRRDNFRREIYLILSGVLLLALAVQITHSQYLLRFSVNQKLAGQIEENKFRRVDPQTLVSSESPFCLAYDSDNEGSAEIEANVEKVLQYMKKPSAVFDLSLKPLQTAGCQAVIASTPALGKLGDPDRLSEYVENGGYMFLTQPVDADDSYYRLYRKLGIVNSGSPITDIPGIKLTSPILIGSQGFEIDDPSITNSLMAVELEPNSKVLATTAAGQPLIWEHAYGKGKFMVFNGTMLQEKTSRGLIAGGIGLLIPDFVYPVFNSKVMFIDDFPAPIPQGKNEQIYHDYRMDIPAFFHSVWWPDMLKAAKKYDFRYSAVLIESYQDRVEPPFENPSDQDRKGLISYGREVIKSGGEIGLHGYNHQSLQTLESTAEEFGYKAWGSVDEMAASVGEALAYFRSAFPQYDMVTYVPPSNVLSAEGREALKRSWPDLAVLSSLYGEDASGLAYVQEYEIASDGILEMPRVSSGYLDSAYDRWADANALTSLGLYSHFLHPDDLLDPARSQYLNWERLYKQYSGILQRVESSYPWLRSMTATEAALDMSDVLTSKVDWHRSGKTLYGTIDPFNRPEYFVLRTDKKFGKLQGCDVRKIDEGTYLIRAVQSQFNMELGE